METIKQQPSDNIVSRTMKIEKDKKNKEKLLKHS
jgi:hypothetical protein